MSNETASVICLSGICQWVLTSNGQLSCIDGPGNCLDARLLSAAPANFHDQTLVNLTQQINALLQAVPPDPSGRKLSFMQMRMGMLLGWVKHGQAGSVPADAVTAAADNATLIQALGLIL